MGECRPESGYTQNLSQAVPPPALPGRQFCVEHQQKNSEGSQMAKEFAYFMYFPGNYRWSAGFINMLSSAPYGGSEIGELHKIGSMLKDKAPEDDEAWFDACVRVADGVRAHAAKFEQGGYRHSAAHAYLRACNYYQMGERFRTPKDGKALDAFRAGVGCFHRHAALTDLNIEIVEIPSEGGS